jgi:hypothetical protein
MEYRDALSAETNLCEWADATRRALKANLDGSQEQEQEQPELLLV